jgi:hypothetical protein
MGYELLQISSDERQPTSDTRQQLIFERTNCSTNATSRQQQHITPHSNLHGFFSQTKWITNSPVLFFSSLRGDNEMILILNLKFDRIRRDQ